VDNNVWLLGDEREVLVTDAPHDAAAVAEAVGNRRVVALACTHAHDDHLRVAPALAERTNAPILMHPDDRVLWDLVHSDREPDGDLRDGQVIEVAGTSIHVVHTPGSRARRGLLLGPRSRGGVQRRHAVRRRAGRDRLLVQQLPDHPGLDPGPAVRTAPRDATRVLPGHGDETTVGAEAPSYDEWVRPRLLSAAVRGLTALPYARVS